MFVHVILVQYQRQIYVGLVSQSAIHYTPINIDHILTAYVFLRSPTMMGCIFAVGREYFFHIGGFDEGMDIWGGENIDLPVRVGIVIHKLA